ncbi:MAG: DUF4905 domain-containing protein [Daejeonella sp.]
MSHHTDPMQPVISEKFSGLIWKIKIQEQLGLIAIESRNSDLKQVAFTVLNFISGVVHFKEISYNEQWNLSLAFIGEKNVVINGYGHSDRPESKGIMSVSLADGSVLWERFNISLNEVHESGIQVYDPRFQPRKYSWIDHLTSDTIVAQSREPVAGSTIVFPEIDNAINIPSFIKHEQIAGDISALLFANKTILSFHETKDGFFQQRLIVYQEDKILIDDILISGIQKLQPEAFFIQQNHLLYIRDKQEIISHLV